jgi:predicted DNA-binding protein (UPF0251 family)
MPRPFLCRTIEQVPTVTFFKPQGVPLRDLEVVRLALDELEAMRLVDLDGLYQEEAAVQMGVSRPTLGRILEKGSAPGGRSLRSFDPARKARFWTRAGNGRSLGSP